MKRKTFTGVLINYNRLNCSVNGNPAFSGTFQNATGATITGRTASDAACGYSFLNNRDNEKIIEYHETKTGRIIFDYIREN